MTKGYVINVTSNLVVCTSRLAWGREENLRAGNTDSNSLKDAFAVKHTGTVLPLAINFSILLYQGRPDWYLNVKSPQHTFVRDQNKLMVS